MSISSPPTSRPLLDAHVHFVGNGSSGSGCWLKLSGFHQPLARFMLSHIGLPGHALSGDFDRLFLEALLRLIRESSLQQVVLLAHDLVYREDGTVMDGVGSFHVPNEHVLKLASEHPEFLPAVSIHPARKDAIASLEKAAEQGAVMMKCLPNCHNIDCSLPQYRPFWKRMAELGIPLLAHTGGEHTVPVVRAEFSDPHILRSPLDCGVRVIAAHCATRSGLMDPDYFPRFREMLKTHPHLYGDTSAFNLPMRGQWIRSCIDPEMERKLVHGSDFPVPIQGMWAWLRGHVSFKEWRRCARIRNVLERDYQLKKAMGFSSAHFTRAWDLLPGKAALGRTL